MDHEIYNDCEKLITYTLNKYYKSRLNLFKKIGYEIEDLKQEGLIVSMKALNSPKLKEYKFSTIFVNMLRFRFNKILMIGRAKKRAGQKDEVFFEEIKDDILFDCKNSFSFENDSIVNIELEEFIKNLSARDRKIIFLKFYGHPPEYIAEQVGLSRAGVYVVLNIIRENFKSKIGVVV